VNTSRSHSLAQVACRKRQGAQRRNPDCCRLP